ncbi:MAG: sigma-54-dependent Fis family transcriptional regulator [Desulfobacterium sp.]|nr:sigma-54-dependent Fis family transcriptional regulator [Desulfobacterium sp.]
MALILIIDDDTNFCGTMESLILRMGHDCLKAETLKQGMEILATRDVDILLLDVRLPDGNGLEWLPQIKEKSISNPEIFIVTGLGDPDGAEAAIQEGVWDYIVKPTSVKQTKLSLTRALKYREEKKSKKQTVAINLDRIIGESPVIKQCFESLTRAAVSNAPVLVTGETGTGKELFANTIHDNSVRSLNNFVVVDCAALTESLLESTLFGHKKGAFTGAADKRTGLVKLADKGTLFLDEVGEMPLSTQKSFLRVLQEKRFRPVGDSLEISSDFRLIAATNRDLHAMVKKGEFRQDLLYRLCAVQLRIPPLRERGPDIKKLAMFHVNRLCDDYQVPNKGFEQVFFDTLNAYHWPGNVRELFNILETAFVASGYEKTLYAMHLPRAIRIQVAKASIQRGADRPHGLETPETGLPTFKEFKHLMEIKYLKKIIAETRGDVQTILKRSGLSKSHFYSLLKKYNLKV